MVSKTDINATQTFVYKNRFNSEDIEDINRGDLSFAVAIFNNDWKEFLPENLGTLILKITNGYTMIMPLNK